MRGRAAGAPSRAHGYPPAMRPPLPTAGLALAVLAAFALASPPAARAADEEPYEPTGEVQFRSRGAMWSGASFDGGRVVGPLINVARRDDGSWAGDLGGESTDLTVTGARATGVNVNIHFERKGKATEIQGLLFGQRVRFELSDKRFRGRLGECSFDLKRRRPGVYVGDVGCLADGVPRTARATLNLTGDAALDEPPLPQVALALIAALPG